MRRMTRWPSLTVDEGGLWRSKMGWHMRREWPQNREVWNINRIISVLQCLGRNLPKKLYDQLDLSKTLCEQPHAVLYVAPTTNVQYSYVALLHTSLKFNADIIQATDIHVVLHPTKDKTEWTIKLLSFIHRGLEEGIIYVCCLDESKLGL